MFGLLNSSQIYGLQQAHEHHISSISINSDSCNKKNNNSSSNSNHKINFNKKTKHRNHHRSSSSVSDSVKTEKNFFATLSSIHGLKTPTNLIEKFLKSELLSGYDTIKNYTNLQYFTAAATTTTTTTETSTETVTTATVTTTKHSTPTTTTTSTSTSTSTPTTQTAYSDTILAGFNCLQGSYRTSCDSEFYETININNNNHNNINNNNNKNKLNNLINQRARDKSSANEMTIKCSKNLLAEPPQIQAPATLQNYQKLPDDMEVLTPSSGASSGEFNNDATITTSTTTATTSTTKTNSSNANNLYKRLSWGSRNSKNLEITVQNQAIGNEVPSDNSTSSISTTTTHSSSANTTSTSAKSNDLQRSSSASSSSGDCTLLRERKKSIAGLDVNMTTNIPLTPERAQRRKLMQMISNYDQQNKQLQRELAKEKRRRTEELACVVKSLLCFESKLKNDMKSVNQRLFEKDAEICRLVQYNRALKKKLAQVQRIQREQACDEGVVEDDTDEIMEQKNVDEKANENDLMEDCLVLEALQCINCKKQFYDIDLNDATELANSDRQIGCNKDGNRKHDNHHTNGHGSSSDDTVSSSFYGARRSVRYTSKRTSGTFRDYMRSRSMNIDDPSLEQNSEENTSTISRDDSNTSYEKLNIYSRTIERMHGVKTGGVECGTIVLDADSKRPSSRSSNKSNSSSSRNSSKASAAEQMEEDDGIFSPTQDDDYDEFGETNSNPNAAANNRTIKIVQRRSRDFSEASPKQVYETSTDDWYASASDQEEIVITSNTTTKSYGQGAVNPVLECVNQILLQQSMEEPVTPSTPNIVVVTSEPTTPMTPKPSNLVHTANATNNLPRRSSLSGRRSSRSNSHSSDGIATPRNGTLTRKRVHFSTKNSMVHVPRNDDVDDEDDDITTPMISDMQTTATTTFPHALYNYGVSSAMGTVTTTITTATATQNQNITDTLNYESIYSNEYEPIGSEHNSSNLYVDMDATNKLQATLDAKSAKMPPALPPKPTNLLKFKKSLHQLDELPDEHLQQDACVSATSSSSANSEPDYCSISEVNVAVTSVQIVADVHTAPESVASLETPSSELDLEVSTVASDDDLCAASQKTDEIEEIFADIPKLPNVAAIIAPKQKTKYEQQQQQQQLQQAKTPTKHADYMLMTPKLNIKPNSQKLPSNKLLITPQKPTNLRLDLSTTPLKSNLHGQYKRKHMPNILAEINKRMSLPNSPTTPTKTTTPTKLKPSPGQSPQQLLNSIDENNTSMPLQAEFDWYNLDAEYGRATHTNSDSLKLNDSLNSNGMLADIKEDHESVVAAADEYNLDEEFSLASDKADDDDDAIHELHEPHYDPAPIKLSPKPALVSTASSRIICEAINFPLIDNDNSPHLLVPTNAKATKIKKNLDNFEKFIEGSGLSTKPLPSKRKIYFAGPFV